MRTIVHLSDLHFGRHDEEVVRGLIPVVERSGADLVVVSGDFTQRARTREFELARDFLGKLTAPVLAVPGNHDVPLFDLASRIFRPLERYRSFIQDDLQPFFVDQEIAIVGINSARSATFKNGRINEAQISLCCERLSSAPADAVRVVVTHHPFDLPQAGTSSAVVGRARMAMSGLTACGVDMILSGHFHLSHTASSAERYQVEDRSILLVQAGTATSTRQRGQDNSCNIIRVDQARLSIECLVWNFESGSFERGAVEAFEKRAAGYFSVS